MTKKSYKRQTKQAVKQLKKAPVWVIVVAVILVIAIGVGYFAYIKFFKKDEFIQPVGDISFHFMTLGNNRNGDCTYIKAGDKDILIDAGSYYDSIDDIEDYLSSYVTDGKIEYLIATHAHEDHIACLGGKNGSRTVFDAYKCEVIIDFPMSESTSNLYKNYKNKRDEEVSSDGATHYTALQCYNNDGGAQREYQLSESVSMEILYQYYYEHDASSENDYSVCLMFKHGSRQFLFTGDLEKAGEEKLAEKYDFTQVELFKAGHHGSQTASNDVLLDEIKPKIVIIPGVVGNDQYDVTDPDDIFPSRRVLESVAKYTSKVYAPVISDADGNNLVALNGNIVVTSSETGVDVNCSNNNTLLKNTDWCKTNRANISWVA